MHGPHVIAVLGNATLEHFHNDWRTRMKNVMTALVALTFAAVLSTAAFAETVITADLWDKGDNIDMVDNLKIQDNPDLSTATMGITLSQTTAPAGEIRFNATNSSKILVHEMVIATLPDQAAGLVYLPDELKVDEEATGANIGEVPELEPGQTGSLSLTLAKGTYAIYCNIAGHYAAGMWTILTVQ